MKYQLTTVTVKKLAALNEAIEKTERGTRIPTGSFFSKTGEKGTKEAHTRSGRPNRE